MPSAQQSSPDCNEDVTRNRDRETSNVARREREREATAPPANSQLRRMSMDVSSWKQIKDLKFYFCSPLSAGLLSFVCLSSPCPRFPRAVPLFCCACHNRQQLNAVSLLRFRRPQPSPAQPSSDCIKFYGGGSHLRPSPHRRILYLFFFSFF